VKGENTRLNGRSKEADMNNGIFTGYGSQEKGEKNYGRFPANLILSYPENDYLCKDNLTKEQKDKLYKWLNENT
jgi:hypothetical protein